MNEPEEFFCEDCKRHFQDFEKQDHLSHEIFSLLEVNKAIKPGEILSRVKKDLEAGRKSTYLGWILDKNLDHYSLLHFIEAHFKSMLNPQIRAKIRQLGMPFVFRMDFSLRDIYLVLSQFYTQEAGGV